MKPWLTIIGIGDDGLAGLSASSLAMVNSATTIFGSIRVVTQQDFPGVAVHNWEDGYEATLAKLMARRGEPTVLLATGDPMHFGIGATLSENLFANEIESIPTQSAFSLAASRLKWPLQHVACISLHGRPVAALARHLAPRVRILALTSSGQTIAEAAALLVSSGYGRSRMTVLEHMGGAKERLVELRPHEAGGHSFADLNTLAIECDNAPEAHFFSSSSGLPDDVFQHDGQLTKREVRAATLAQLQPFPGAMLWDVGAGCGSIGIEWTRAAPGAKAIAIEENPARIAMIEANAKALGVPELKIIVGKAPTALNGLPEPDAVFIGGGIADAGVFDAAFGALRPGGILVANAVTIEGEAQLVKLAGEHNGGLSRIAVSRAEAVGDYKAFKPMMPVTTLTIRKTRAT